VRACKGVFVVLFLGHSVTLQYNPNLLDKIDNVLFFKVMIDSYGSIHSQLRGPNCAFTRNVLLARIMFYLYCYMKFNINLSIVNTRRSVVLPLL